MCRIMTKDKDGRIVCRGMESVKGKISRVTRFGVYESGVQRSPLMAQRSSRGGASSVLPFSIR